jgi:TPP-dependent pyruvate/acetoin dehydrogenase alpha subunit
VTTQVGIDIGRLGLTTENLLDTRRLMGLTRDVDSRVRMLYRQGQVFGGVYSQVGPESAFDRMFRDAGMRSTAWLR